MKNTDEQQTKLRAAEPDATLHRSGTELHTLVRAEPEGTLVRQSTEDSGTAARTLQAGRPVQGPDAAFAPTLKAPESGARDALSQQPGSLEPGSVIKQRFVLETMLGKGGMGLVFGAVDRRKLEARDPNPHVALKVLNADFARHPQSFMALQREARKAQTLAHPNVVTVFDFDRDGDTVYMTMELLKGRSLDTIVREGRGKGNSAEFALPIIRGIAEGLAYAHRKGIVHSDLKPGNVFIASDGTAKILDFGIARAVPSSITEENKDEFDAGSLGAYTEAYATDEMVAGVDPHTADDMYALGIIAYELVTGFHPYQRHSAPNARKLGIKPTPLKGLKRKHARAIERCLSFERKDRPQTAGDFLKLFRGVTRLQKSTLAASAVLALTAGYFGYQNYLETSPAIAFAELPATSQQDFRTAMKQGDAAWAFYENEGLSDGIMSALQSYAAAYDIHPRNREAVAALNRAADEVLRLTENDPARRHEMAERLQQLSAHFRKYAPVVDAAR
ncbi:serine/threonine-protein kinase [Peristeroidobacter agariperforans]|uniref:serine/threonine-protein kinase n=1 Tax=Peristeroidobacter agariperforans TaxID=268404 RepID=UPI00101E00C8|nr:serine/threonine-protein kinase [Peristeroidobacter agariperforans]